jgi:hypothetical protein
MKRAIPIFALIAAAFVPALAQKVETENADRKQIIHLKTALDHLTVIELGEPVLQVASGSAFFRIEWRENKVFVQPTEADARTNLFIWTATERLNYELEPAGSVSDMDFAIDQPAARGNPIASTGGNPEPAPLSMSDLWLESQPVRMLSTQRPSKPVQVWINDLYEKNGQLLVLYTVFNNGSDTYSLKPPSVFQLDGVRAPQSLYTLTNFQLSDELAGKLKVKHRTPVKTLEQQLQTETLAPGDSAIGIVSLEMASNRVPTLLSFQFSNENKSSGHTGPPITAYLVR